MHLAAGGAFALVLAPVLLISFFGVYPYFLWALVVVVLRFIPKLRRGLTGVHLPAAGVLCVIVFLNVADSMQWPNMSREFLLRGAMVLALLIIVVASLIYVGLRKQTHRVGVSA